MLAAVAEELAADADVLAAVAEDLAAEADVLAADAAVSARATDSLICWSLLVTVVAAFLASVIACLESAFNL